MMATMIDRVREVIASGAQAALANLSAEERENVLRALGTIGRKGELSKAEKALIARLDASARRALVQEATRQGHAVLRDFVHDVEGLFL